MKFEAHGYQQRAVDWVESHARCLLFLDMGLGKSVVTLTAVERLIRYGEAERVLVVAPKKVAESTWSSEAAKWDHLAGLRVEVVAGNARQRLAALEREADVWVIGRDSVVWLEEALSAPLAAHGAPLARVVEEPQAAPTGLRGAALAGEGHRGSSGAGGSGRSGGSSGAGGSALRGFDMVVIDELTSFKNYRSLRFKALRRLLPGAQRVVGLTGTPTPNGLGDLWGQVFCVDGGERLGRFVTHFRRRWFDCVVHNNIIIRMTPKPGAEEEIMGLISDIALTMRAEDWLELPGMLEEDVRVALPEGVAAAYRKFERERVAEVIREAGGDVGAVTAASAAALTGKLAQYANGAVYDDDGEVAVIHDEKLRALGEILEVDEGPVLCFYQYTHDRDRIMERFASLRPRHYQGAADLDDWNGGRIRLLLAHPASTAFGLNMQAGGHRIVWFSTGWNLELYQQANARLHRQGQLRPVMVQRLIAVGTVDERMAAALSGKGISQAELLAGLAGAGGAGGAAGGGDGGAFGAGLFRRRERRPRD